MKEWFSIQEIPYEVILLKREGANAVAKLVPSLQRTVKDLLAGEWINGDGYQHNVFVKWHNGEIVRPKTWFWQDVRNSVIYPANDVQLLSDHIPTLGEITWL